MRYIKTFNEGRLNKTAEKVHKGAEEIDAVRTKVEGILKSRNIDYKTVGNDLEFDHNDVQINLMFRPEYIGIKQSGKKYVDEFKYDQFGKFKTKLSEVLK